MERSEILKEIEKLELNEREEESLRGVLYLLLGAANSLSTERFFNHCMPFAEKQIAMLTDTKDKFQC